MQILAPVLSTDVRNRAKDYLRLAIAKAAVGQNGGSDEALAFFKSRWGRSVNLPTVEKAAFAPNRRSAVSPGTFGDGGAWGSELAAQRQLADAFGELLRARTVIDRLPAARPVPFNIAAPTQTAGATARWTPEGGAYQLSPITYVSTTLAPAKIGGVAVASTDLVRLSDPSADTLIRRDLEAVAVEFSDVSFLNPSLAPVDGQQPGAVTYGATTIESSGSTAAAARLDFRRLFDAVAGDLTGAVVIMRKRTAVGLASMGPPFDTVTAVGGSLWGLPVLVSEAAPVDGNSPAEDTVTLLDSAELLIADDGIEVAAFTEGDVQLNDSPDSPWTGSTPIASLWMHNLIAFRMTRFVAWKLRRSDAVAMLVGARYAE